MNENMIDTGNDNSSTAVIEASTPVIEQVPPTPIPEQPAPEAPAQGAPPEDRLQNVDVKLARAISGNMMAVYVTVKRPTARPKTKGAKVEVKADSGDQQIAIENKDITTPCWKIDFNPIWREVDATKTEVDKVLEYYSANDSQKGEHLVSAVTVAEMVSKLDKIREKRLEIVDRMKEIWDTEILPGIREKHPEHYHQIIDGLPSKHGLRSAFNVIWAIRPLTATAGEDMILDALNEDDAKRVVARTNSMIDDMFKQRFANIFDDVFGQISEVCAKIEADGLGGGRRNQASIDSILTILDRVQNFRQFANEPVLQQIAKVKAALKAVSVQDINKHEEVRNQLKDAFRPLAQAVKELTEQQIGGGRSNRSVNI